MEKGQTRLSYKVKKQRTRNVYESPVKNKISSASALLNLLDSSDDESPVITPTKGYWDSPSKPPASPLKLKKVHVDAASKPILGIPSSVWMSPKKECFSPQRNSLSEATHSYSPSKARVSLFGSSNDKLTSSTKNATLLRTQKKDRAEPDDAEVGKSPSTRLAGLCLGSPLQSQRMPFGSPKRKASESGLSSPHKRLTPSKNENRSSIRRSTVDITSPKRTPTKCVTSPKQTPTKNVASAKTSKKTPVKLSLFNPRVDDYVVARKSLHTLLTPAIVGREKEIEALEKFLSDHIDDKRPGSLYVSGAPGTGKTATLTKLMEKRQKKGVKSLFVNCMTVKNSTSIFQKIAASLDPNYTKKNEKETIKFLKGNFTSEGPMILLVLDEIDQLDTRNQDVLYTVWEWPSLKNSRLVLIGVANALDLTDRMLPRLQAKPKCRPQLLNFRPYTKKELTSILQNRLQDSAEFVVKPRALEFLAGKIAAVSGDARKVLDVCRRAVELAEGEARKQRVLKVTCDDGQNRSSSKKPENVGPLVDVTQVAQILNDIYVNNTVAKVRENADGIPLQQKVAMATLLLIMKKGKTKEVTIFKLFEVYRRICRRRNLPETEQSEFHSVCSALEDQGFVICKKNKDSRQSKLRLKLDEGEVEAAFQDKNMFASILKEEECLSANYVFK